MIYQIEITTYCNAKCFYCPNEYLHKQHMPIEQFKSIINESQKGCMVLMQGTGEPLLHPQFWEMVSYVKARGNKVGIITNGTIAIADEQLEQIDTIGFSIDTLSAKVAKHSGRPDPIPILDIVTHYHSIAPKKIRIYSVDYGQDIAPLKSHVEKLGINLTVQRIQGKTAYQKRYTTPQLPYQYLRCRYIENEIHRFFFVNGKQSPCCFMIDVENALSVEEIADYFNRGIVPQCCNQCGELVGISRVSSRTNMEVRL